jgi:hypothetical protein
VFERGHWRLWLPDNPLRLQFTQALEAFLLRGRILLSRRMPSRPRRSAKTPEPEIAGAFRAGRWVRRCVRVSRRSVTVAAALRELGMRRFTAVSVSCWALVSAVGPGCFTDSFVRMLGSAGADTTATRSADIDEGSTGGTASTGACVEASMRCNDGCVDGCTGPVFNRSAGLCEPREEATACAHRSAS